LNRRLGFRHETQQAQETCVGWSLPFGYPSTTLRASAQGPR